MTDGLQLRQKIFSSIGTNSVLYQRGREQGLADMILNNPCNGKSVLKTRLASSMEAIIGVAWIDSGISLEDVRRVMEKLRIY